MLPTDRTLAYLEAVSRPRPIPRPLCCPTCGRDELRTGVSKLYRCGGCGRTFDALAELSPVSELARAREPRVVDPAVSDARTAGDERGGA